MFREDTSFWECAAVVGMLIAAGLAFLILGPPFLIFMWVRNNVRHLMGKEPLFR